MAVTPLPNTSLPKEKILVEFKPMVLPTILNMENLIIVGSFAIGTIAAVIFHIGATELLIIGAIWLFLFALPSFKTIFEAGSTNYVLTNYRLLIFKVGLGPRERSIPLDQIQKVSSKATGLQGFYRAGDLIIKQKGLRGTIRLVGLPEVRKRVDQIQQAIKKLASSENHPAS